MSAKHTPGPWDACSDIVKERRDKWVIISQPFTNGRDGPVLPLETRIANARLIATAPDMLETLEAIRDRAMDKTIELHPDSDAKGCVDDVLEWAESAIRKARGGEP